MLRGTDRTTTRRVLAAVSCSLALLGAAACASDETSASASSTAGSTADSDGTTVDPASELVGTGCSDYAARVPSGAGSVAGMAKDRMATAANNNPLLKTLTRAVSGKLNSEVNLVNDLNGAQLTVFAPVDSAFAKLPPATLTTLSEPGNAQRLTTILTTHVVNGQMAPSDIDGVKSTLAGNKITVKGSGDDITVNGAHVVCGGMRTANATVYLIDSVIKPAGGHF